MLKFRYRFLLGIAHRLGRFLYRAQRGVWPPFFGLILTIVGLWLAELIHHILYSAATSWFQWWVVLLAYAVLDLLVYTYQARKRVVIENFTDYTGPQSASDSHGLSSLLVVKLAQLHDLYCEVNEQRAVSTLANTSHPIDATIKVDDIGDFLSNAITVQTTVNVGPFQIPIGTVMALVGRLVQGPRVVGSLHQDHDTLILMAQQVGTRPSYKWRVESVASDVSQANLDNMVSELAYRMFTDLALSGTVRWKATKAFSEGLRIYRNSLRMTKDRRIHLRKAERKFLKTLEEDREFDLAHYNLGVVYMELGQMETAASQFSVSSRQANKAEESEHLAAAEEAFLQAISCKPGSWVNYYALAICRFQCGEFGAVIQLCDRIRRRMIAKKPGKMNIAKITHMVGLSQNMSNDHVFAIKSLKKAVRQAWWALCVAQLLQLGVSGTESLLIPQLEVTLGICLKDLARAYMQSADGEMKRKAFDNAERNYHYAEELLSQATFLIAADAKNYFELFHLYIDNFIHLGDVYSARLEYKFATQAYKSAIRLLPEEVSYWLYLARAYVDWHKVQKQWHQNDDIALIREALTACQKAINATTNLLGCTCNTVTDEKCEWHTLLEVYVYCDTYRDRLRPEAEAGITAMDIEAGIKVIHEVASLSSSAVATKPLDEVAAEIGQVAEKLRGWVYAQVALPVANVYLKSRRYCDAEMFIVNAIECLEETFTHIISAQELRVIEVYTLLHQGQCEKALNRVESALALDPLCYWEWVALGDVYFKLNAFQNAIDAWKEALLRQNSVGLRPNRGELPYIESPILDFKLGITYALAQKDVDINFKIGVSYIELGRHDSDVVQKREAFQQAINYLEMVATLYEGDTERQQQKNYLFYFLGVLYFEQGDYQRAISSLRVAKTLSFAPLTALFYLACTYLKNKEYDSCVRHFQLLRDEAQKLEQNMALDTIVEAQSVGFMSLGELLAMANWGIAFAYAECDANLDEAHIYICKAHTYMEKLSVSTRKHWPAYHFDCEGWILFKQGQSKDALKALQQAASLSAFPQVYIHLSYVYISQLQQMKSPNVAVMQLLHSCYQHAQTLDIRQEYTQDIQHLLQYVQKYGGINAT